MAPKKGLHISIPWGDPLEGLVEIEQETPTPELDFNNPRPIKTPGKKRRRAPKFVPVQKRKRAYSPLKSRPPCTACDHWKWIVVTDHDRYRDPFLECGHCHETYRMDLSPLDLTFAWRDGIEMPDEIKRKHEPNVDQANYTASYRKHVADERSVLGDPQQQGRRHD